MAIIIGVIFMALFLGAGAGSVFFFVGGSRKGGKVKKGYGIGAAAIAFCMLILFIFIPFGIKTVDAGEIGVVKVFGEARESKTAGVHFVNVLTTEIVILDNKVQQLVIATEVYTQDAQPADVELIVQFRIDSTKAVDIVKSHGTIDMLKTRVEKVSVEKAKVVLSSKTAMKIIETRSELSPAVQESIKTIQDQYYILIESVVITDIAFSSAFEKAVEEKMIAEQKKLEAEYQMAQAIIKAEEEAETARIKAAADLVVARLNAEKALAEAKGMADAEVAVATGAAQALKIQYIETARMLGLPVEETVLCDDEGNISGYEYEIDTVNATDAQYKVLEEYMRYINYLQTWDGKLPTVIGDGSLIGGIIIQP